MRTAVPLQQYCLHASRSQAAFVYVSCVQRGAWGTAFPTPEAVPVHELPVDVGAWALRVALFRQVQLQYGRGARMSP